MEANQLIISILILAVFIALIFYFFSRSKKKPLETPQENYILGLKALLQGQNDDAYRFFKNAVSGDTENVDAYLRLGELLRKRGAVERAYHIHWELSLRRNLTDSERMDVNLAMVDDLFASGKYAEAGKMLRELLKKDSRNVRFLKKLLEVYIRTEDWVNSLPTTEKLAKLDKGSYDDRTLALFRILEGQTKSRDGNHHKARLAYKNALHYDPECAFAYLYMGDAYLADNRPEDAVDWWRKLCEKVPSKGYLAFERLESLLFELGKFNIVAEIYLDILERDPKNTRAMRALAKIQVKMGKINEAIKNSQQALSIDKNNPAIISELIDLYKQADQAEEIVRLAEKYCLSSNSHADKFECSVCHDIFEQPKIICPSCHNVGTVKI